jgi:hypothetical protein
LRSISRETCLGEERGERLALGERLVLGERLFLGEMFLGETSLGEGSLGEMSRGESVGLGVSGVVGGVASFSFCLLLGLKVFTEVCERGK